MDYDRMYDDAITQEKQAMKFVSLMILIISAAFFFAGLTLNQPVLGFEANTVKNILVITSIIVMIGGIIPLAMAKKEKIGY